MYSLTTLLLTTALDQAYFNFTVGAAFVAAAIVIISVTVSNLSKNRKEQKKLLDTLEKQINLRRRLLNDTQSNTWRSTGTEILFTDDIAKFHGVSPRMTYEEFEKMIHKDSMESWKLFQEYHEVLGKKSVRLLIKSPREKEWHWYKVTFNTSQSADVYGYSGIFTCIDDEIKKDEYKRKLQIELKQNQQVFDLMHSGIPAMKRLLTQFFSSADLILKSKPGENEQVMKEANETLHSSADSFRKLSQSFSSTKINKHYNDSGQ